MRLFAFALLPVTSFLALAQPDEEREPCSQDPVVRWNEEAIAAIKAEKTPPPVAARNLAIVHVAVYDAFALASGEYRPFFTGLRVPAGADATVAAAVAGHRALVELYPTRGRHLDDVLDKLL